MILKQFSRNRKLYVAFIDYKKINRDALLNSLKRYGVSGKIFAAIRGIYSNVRNNHEITDFFDCPVGLKQGCLLSPLLFSIFISELSRNINTETRHGIQLLPDMNTIHHLLFADDVILVSDSVTGLQNKLNVLYSQSRRLGLHVNKDKSKIVIFRKGGYLSKHENWTYGNTKLEIVNSYKYLGIDFSTRMSLTNCVTDLVTKAKKASFCIIQSLKRLACNDLKLFSKLFDSKVEPILAYGSELWGLQEHLPIEQVHTTTLKQFLKVSIHSSNTLLYGETARYPLYINHKIRCVKYWLKLLKMHETRIRKQAYEMMRRMSEKNVNSWITDLKYFLYSNGFGCVWLFQSVGNEKAFCNSLKERLCDVFKQSWCGKLTSDPHLHFYSSFKSMIYLNSFLLHRTLPFSLQTTLIRFRLGVSNILCHKYKYSNNINIHLCPLCKKDIEDEHHILLVCKVYENLRLTYLPEKFLKNRCTFNSSLLMSNENYQFHVAKYLHHSIKLRDHFVNMDSESV